MEKLAKYCYGICLLISIAINILFCRNHVYSGGEKTQEIRLSWSKKAAAEAEAVAAFSCSGHGRAFLDGSISEGQPACECYDCYAGIDCSQFSLDGCLLNVHSGDPIYMEPFWMENAANSAVMISGWHRMGYWYDDDSMISTELEKYIRNIHSVVGNAITEGRYMVFGIGSIQLLNAVIYALSSENSSSPSNVVASVPFYSMFKDQTKFFNSKSFQFKGDTSAWQSDSNSSTDNMDVIELVASPNNPDGELKKSILGGKTIYDHAYFWPHFTPIPGPSDHDIMVFSISKLTGHAGTRFGWAIIKDKDIYEKVYTYIEVADLGVSKDTQLRASKLLKVAVEGDGKPLFEFAYNEMKDRWNRLIPLFSKSTRFSIQQRYPLHCNYFNQTKLPSPAYAWVKCEREEDQDCGAILESGNIKGTAGSSFSDQDRYVRLNLMKSRDDFELLLNRLANLLEPLENSIIETL